MRAVINHCTFGCVVSCTSRGTISPSFQVRSLALTRRCFSPCPSPQESSWEAALHEAPPLDAIVCINMTHISPFSATLGLLEAAGEMLVHVGASIKI